ncbi:hypothetical protein [Cyanobacterium sp. Dongsha4]|uniref:hypothetical protein n=1 Tax=Cyanobacterium sp. DS4 TaxID=2878255 RepID=UPI002E81865E|nr:hypothetical protein [Cyanobacterium sp. Dongsha4]WVL00217.1 hypothetical protein Dongsha4_16425 [Cyanobacterium sp. Dongsha4]
MGYSNFVKFRLSSFILFFTMFLTIPNNSAFADNRRCKLPDGKTTTCNVQIYESQLNGYLGYSVTLRFNNQLFIEAFCTDEQSQNCLVRRTKNGIRSKWQKGYIDGSSSYFFHIKTSGGLLLGSYNPPEHI